MKKEREKRPPLKERNPYKYYRNAYYAFQTGEWACIVAPVVAVFGAKWEEYFTFIDGDYTGVKMTLGCILSLVLAAIFAYKKLRHQEKVEGKVTMTSYVVGVGVAFVLSYLFKTVIDDLFLIMGCEFAGAVAAYGVDFGTRNAKSKMETYRKAIEELDAKDAAQRLKRERGTAVE